MIRLLLLILACALGSRGSEDDLAPSVVALRGGTNTASGFFVRTNDTLFLVTAEHVARGIGEHFELILCNRGQKGTVVTGSVVWSFSKTADVAVARIKTDKQGANRGVPIQLMPTTNAGYPRNIPLTVFGYPLELEPTGFVSPITRQTKAASDLVTLIRGDTKKAATFFILQDPSMQGFSGGPVFDTGASFFTDEGSIIYRHGGTMLLGLIHGTLSDDTGGKFAAVVPAGEIWKVIHDDIENSPP